MFEGAMRDNQLYLFNVASQVDNLATYGSVYGKQFIDTLPDVTPDGAKHSTQPRSKDEAKKVVT